MNKWLASISVAGLATAVLTLASCGGGSGKRANVDPGSMPTAGTFTGVWSSPQYGQMHMLQTGSQVVGEYTKDERSGRIQGTVQGDLLRFQWEESRELVMGRPTITRGRGYFKYEVGEDDRHYVVGEWGIDDNEVGGGPWRAYKLKGRSPELTSTAGGEQEPAEEPYDEYGGDDYGSDEYSTEPAADPGGGGGAEPASDDDLDPALEGLDEF